MKTIIEPFKIKMVEPLRLTSPEEREPILRAARFNLFQIRAEDVIIDLLTDSGTSAMSSEQWAGMLRGDEAYAGARSWFRFEAVLRELTGMPHILPTHQGRASERILFELVGGPGKIIPSNNHFDTTRANIEHSGALAVDLVIPEGTQPRTRHPLKGNLDIGRLEGLIAGEGAGRIPMCMVTVTNNSGGGQPVSLANLRDVRAVCRRHGIPLFLDACRFAENPYLIKRREPGQEHRSAREIARDVRPRRRRDDQRQEGRPGQHRRRPPDARRRPGPPRRRVADPHRRLRHLRRTGRPRPRSDGAGVRRGARRGLSPLSPAERRVPRRAPAVGGHPDRRAPRRPRHLHRRRRVLPADPPRPVPGQALVCALYRHAGIRAVEIGGVMFGQVDPDTGESARPPMELVRLAIPRRVYTQGHIDYTVEAAIDLFRNRDAIRGLRIVEAPATLRHFMARFEEV